MGKYKFNPFTKTLDITAEALIHLKDPVDTYNDLPVEGNSENDARFVKDTDDLYVWTSPNPDGDRSNWKRIPLLQNLKLDDVADGSTYGKVKKTELSDGQVKQISDGTNIVTASEAKDAVNKKHTPGSETVGGDLSGTVGNTTVETIGGKSKTDVADAVDKKHEQNKDQYLDYGGANQVSSSQLKEVVNLTPNLMEKVAEVEVSSDCAYVDFTGLDGSSAWFYVLYSSIKNPVTTSSSRYNIFVNGDNSEANYYTQWCYADGTSRNSSRANDATILFLSPSTKGFSCVEITKDMEGYYRWLARECRYDGSNVQLEFRAGCKTATITNITSLRVQASASDGIGAGSKFVLFKVRRG